MSKDTWRKKLKVGDKVRCVSPRSKFEGCQGEVLRIVVDRPNYEQEVAVAWMGHGVFLGQSNRMLVSGLELLSAKKDDDPYADLKKAYADGKTIQVMQPNGVWVDLSSYPKWVWDAAAFRIKPDDPYADLKKAKAEGKIIQISHNGGKSWSDKTDNWKYPPECYRIKPENLEPKFKVDDMVVIRGYRSPGKIMTIVTGIRGNREYVVNMDGAVARVKEEDVKHYSEPLPSLQQVNRSNRGGVRVGELHVIIGRPGTGASHFMSTEVAKQKSTNQQKENTMKLELTTRHFLNGKDISDITLAQLYQTIGMAEQDIRELEKIENKPKRLVKEIEKRKADLKALVDFLDAQDSKDA